MPLKLNTLAWAILTLGLAGPAWSDGFIGGSTPSQRPANAPTVTQFQISPEALGRRLHGVTDPLPNNVVEAALAGPWYMPLAHPGMTPPYDIRGWHRKVSPPASPDRTQ